MTPGTTLGAGLALRRALATASIGIVVGALAFFRVFGVVRGSIQGWSRFLKNLAQMPPCRLIAQ
jgi:hypothetical protein